MAKTFQDYGREWLDTLVVAFSVAMAFRAYFFEPFNIPTGSMQETLWGNHTVACAEVGSWQKGLLNRLNWLGTGRDYKEFIASSSGTLFAVDTSNGRYVMGVASNPKVTVSLPHDVLSKLDLGPKYAGRRLVVHDGQVLAQGAQGRWENVVVSAGQKLWSGYDVSGDFIFVNRMTWNFRKPKAGDVMIFGTTGIKGLPQGTHYIKRMKATPGETYVLEHPVTDRPELPTEVTMGPDEYFACGDNFNNSYDSRYWGSVPGANLRGVGSIVFWPFNGWRIIR